MKAAVEKAIRCLREKRYEEYLEAMMYISKEEYNKYVEVIDPRTTLEDVAIEKIYWKKYRHKYPHGIIGVKLHQSKRNARHELRIRR